MSSDRTHLSAPSFSAVAIDTIGALTTALADRYAIEREVGKGGMATVYLARDLKHDRMVALKVLDPELAAAIGGERFIAEIRTTAALHHPHILPLHDSGVADGFLFYAMPYVAGETLRARVDREKQLPIADALRIAKETASALDYAHRHGVIHRDVKPENILLHEGSALVADFGIALAVQSAGSTRLTQTGLSLGTPQYMSPEQAMGEKAIDARTDVYALGAVLYEMMTGEPPFTGATVQAIVAKVMTESPTSPRAVRATVPPGAERAILTALAKLPADRFASAAAFAAALDAEAVLSETLPSPRPTAIARRRARGVMAAVVAASVVAGFGLARLASRVFAAPMPSPRSYVVASLAADEVGLYTLAKRFDVSRDGERVVFRSVDSAGHGALFIRERGVVEPHILAGSDPTAFAPFFSPDGRWVGYMSAAGVMKIPAAGGTPIRLLSAPVSVETGFGIYASWGSDDRILVPLDNVGYRVVMIVSSTGRVVDSLVFGRDTAALHAESLPHDRVLLGLGLAPRTMHVVVREPDGTMRDLFEGYQPRVIPSGYIAYLTLEGSVWVLMAREFDAASARVRGEPMTLARNVPVGFDTPAAGTLDGDLVYMEGQPRTDRSIVTIDRQGNERPVTRGTRAWETGLDLSADGTMLADQEWDGGTRSLWTITTNTGAVSRVTRDHDVFGPKWTPDGKSLIIGCPAGCAPGSGWIWRVATDGASALQPLATPASAFVRSVSAGNVMYFDVVSQATETDIWELPLGDPAAKASAVLATPASEFDAVGSPDSRWLAFATRSSGSTEVRIGARSNLGGARQVSTEGGVPLRWSPDGRKFYYRNGRDVWEMSVAASGPVFSSARRAFPLPEGIIGDPVVSPDGERIYAIRGGLMYSDLIVKQGVFNRR